MDFNEVEAYNIIDRLRSLLDQQTINSIANQLVAKREEIFSNEEIATNGYPWEAIDERLEEWFIERSTDDHRTGDEDEGKYLVEANRQAEGPQY